MPPDLAENVKAALIELLRETRERDRFPRSPRVKPLRGVLAKLGVSSNGGDAGTKAAGEAEHRVDEGAAGRAACN